MVVGNDVKRRGRPVFSNIRQNIVDMLLVLGSATGYTLSKKYPLFFTKCTQRVIYYHLRKGVTLDIFAVQKISIDSGNYSWGPSSEKIFYTLGKNAVASMRPELEVLKIVDSKEKKI